MMRLSPQDDCGPCTDIPSMDDLAILKTPHQMNFFQFMLVAVVMLCRPVFLASQNEPVYTPFFSALQSSKLKRLRTVILLI